MGPVETQKVLEALGQISPVLPFLVQLIVTGLAVLVAWALFSIIGYWIYEVLAPAIERTIAVVALMRSNLAQKAGEWLGRRRAPVSEFVDLHAQSVALNNDNAQVRDAIAATQYAVASLPSSIAAIERSFNEARLDVERGMNSVERMQYPAALAVPSPEEYSQVQVGANNALLITIVFAFFSVVLIGVNTLMLNEFFITFFPPLKIGPIKLAIVGACLFSLLEFAGGAAIAFVDGNDRKAANKKLSLIIAIASLATLELGFYAKFGQGFGFNPFSDVFPEDTTAGLILKSWFGIFGPAVVFIMAWCGDMLFTGIRGLTRNQVARQWRSYLRAREAAADNVQRRVIATAASVEALKKALHTVDRAFHETDGDRGLTGKVEAAQRAFTDAINTAKAVQLGDVKPLGSSEMLRLYMSHIFLTGSCLVAAVFLILFYSPLGIGISYLRPDIDHPSSIIAALECAILLGAGYVSTKAGNHVSPGMHAITTSGWARWPLIIFLTILVCTILAANAFFIFQLDSTIAAMWFALTAAASLWLFRCGQSLGLMIAASWAFLKATVAVCLSLVFWALSVMFWVVALLIVVFRGFLLLLRYPYLMLFERRNGKLSSPVVAREQA